MKRLLTAAVGIPFALLITLYSPQWLMAFTVGVLAALMLEEFLNLGAARGLSRPGRWFSILGGVVAASFSGYPDTVIVSLVAVCLLHMTISAVRGSTRAFSDVVLGLSGLVYCSVLWGFMAILDRHALVVLLAVIWAGDSAAYYVGRAWGRHFLAPQLSPKKTVEGAVAGLAGSLAAGVVIGGWLFDAGAAYLAAVTAITAIAGQIGDLAESALKRSAGVKDSSSILPGHGGILDRLDSLLFAAPVFYFLFKP